VVNLNELVMRLQKMLVRLIGEDVVLHTVLAPGLGSVKIDPGQFEQALVNLAVNARDAMPDGGTLLIETANVELDERYCASHPNVVPGAFVLVAVTDTGIGMSEGVRSRLFEPFFTTKPKGRGTGLGLATTFGAVAQVGGTIEVHSQVGIGTTFKIYLPRIAELPAGVPAGPPSELQLGRGEHVLLVEDDAGVRTLTAAMLDQLGYSVRQAPNGIEALKWASQRREPIDLLMTDVVMPGLNGRELAEGLLRLHPNVKVLFTSGYTENIIVHRGLVDPSLNFIAKPYSMQALAAKLKEVLRSSAPR